MSWVFLALLAPALYAVNVFLDKYLIASKFPDYRALPIFGAILAIPVVIILRFFGADFLNFKDSFFIILSGIFTIIAFSIYLEALIKEETSVIIIMLQLIPVMVLIMSYLFLGDTITFKQLIGFVLLFISSLLASLKKTRGAFKFSNVILLMLAADILWALPYIFIKNVSTSINFSSLIAYESIGVFLGGILMLFFVPKIRTAFVKTIRQIKKPVLGLVFLNESIFLTDKALTYLAVTLGPVALVSILGSTQIFFGLLLGILLTMLLPKVFKEDLSKNSLFKKGLLGLLAFVGIILVS